MEDEKALEFRALTSQWKQQVTDFFEELKDAGDYKYFHPHPLTAKEAEIRCNYAGNDIYYISVEGKQILGYGMLRGWDEGYEIPSLGIVIHQSARGIGLGKTFIHFLHVIARRKGAKRIRVKVYTENVVALKLYEGIGYKFHAAEEGQKIGFFNL
ncbi:MAG: GNAT family N-acetyltransferase [Deltaproteobacteria bacterium]|jgi:ribosomal protein S18 acetylase RimI-like enzyme|nr:GNAT family N-acetyltransferase [Deltaproteobacteria bacterium]